MKFGKFYLPNNLSEILVDYLKILATIHTYYLSKEIRPHF